MSTENNSDLLFDNSIKILSDLIGFKTISGEDNNSEIIPSSYWKTIRRFLRRMY